MDMVFGIPFKNRPTEADTRTVRLFLEPLPVRIAFQQDAGNPACILHGYLSAAAITLPQCSLYRSGPSPMQCRGAD